MTMWTVLCVLVLMCSGTYTWPQDADCVTAGGSVGSCVAPADCTPSYHAGKPVLCRYARGYGMRICCPHSSIRNLYTYTSTNSREDLYNDDQPIYFPSEPSHSNIRPNFQQTTSYYNNNPFSTEGQYYQPYNPRPSHNRPPLHVKPSEPVDTSYGYQERPRPSVGFPVSPRPSNGGQTRPDRNRPRPAAWGSSEDDSLWEDPLLKRTTPRPTWAVVDNSREPSSNSNKRISEQKCEEYSRPVSQTIDVLPLSLDTEAVPLRVQKCDFSAIKLIVGGEASELGEFPHMAAIGFRSTNSYDTIWNCGGTLISDHYVMTAAHCTNTSFGNPVVVRLGEYNIVSENDGAEPVDYRIERIIVHPDYHKSLKYNDIALLRLNRAVSFNKWIRPACLPSSDAYRGRKPTATGWGRTDFVGRQSDRLMKVSLNLIENRQCNTYYNTNNPGATSFSSGITDTMICAGVLEGGQDTCLGDSGGPLTVTKAENPCVHYVIGITSFGKVCGAPNAPGIYTKVSKYLPWIERTVW